MAAQARKSASLDVAKAVFKAKITRDPDGLQGAEVDQFFKLLDAATMHTEDYTVKVSTCEQATLISRALSNLAGAKSSYSLPCSGSELI